MRRFIPSVRAELVEAPSFLPNRREGKEGPSTGSGRTAAEAARILFTSAALLTLSACARQIPAAVAAGAPGILRGLWDGFIFPWAWVVSLFVPEVSVYAVPNNGGWYDFGYFLGIVVFGVGARKTRIVYRTARTRRRGVVDAKVIRDEEA